MPQVSTVGGFEGTLPAYWNPGRSARGGDAYLGDGPVPLDGPLAEDRQDRRRPTRRHGSRATCATSGRRSTPKTVDIFLGAYVKTSGVNTNPATNDAQVVHRVRFLGQRGAFIGETKLPIDQTVGTSTGVGGGYERIGADDPAEGLRGR